MFLYLSADGYSFMVHKIYLLIHTHKKDPDIQYMSEKPGPILYSNLLYRMGQDFLDIKYPT